MTNSTFNENASPWESLSLNAYDSTAGSLTVNLNNAPYVTFALTSDVGLTLDFGRSSVGPGLDFQSDTPGWTDFSVAWSNDQPHGIPWVFMCADTPLVFSLTNDTGDSFEVSMSPPTAQLSDHVLTELESASADAVTLGYFDGESLALTLQNGGGTWMVTANVGLQLDFSQSSSTAVSLEFSSGSYFPSEYTVTVAQNGGTGQSLPYSFPIDDKVNPNTFTITINSSSCGYSWDPQIKVVPPITRSLEG